MKISSLRLMSAIAFLFLPVNADCNPPEKEQLNYRLEWKGARVGSATIVYEKKEDHLALSLKGQSEGIANKLYKISLHIQSRATLDLKRSLFYRRNEVRPGKPKDIHVTFDWDKKLATYENKGHIRPSVELQDSTIDPLCLFFLPRFHELSVGKKIIVNVTDGKRLETTTILVSKKQSIKIDGVTYETFRLDPDTKKLTGTIWVDAASGIPVKAIVVLKVGSFTAFLDTGKKKKSLVGRLFDSIKDIF